MKLVRLAVTGVFAMAMCAAAQAAPVLGLYDDYGHQLGDPAFVSLTPNSATEQVLWLRVNTAAGETITSATLLGVIQDNAGTSPAWGATTFLTPEAMTIGDANHSMIWSGHSVFALGGRQDPFTQVLVAGPALDTMTDSLTLPNGASTGTSGYVAKLYVDTSGFNGTNVKINFADQTIDAGGPLDLSSYFTSDLGTKVALDQSSLTYNVPVSAVPEPATLAALAGLGLIAGPTALWQWRKRRTKNDSPADSSSPDSDSEDSDLAESYSYSADSYSADSYSVDSYSADSYSAESAFSDSPAPPAPAPAKSTSPAAPESIPMADRQQAVPLSPWPMIERRALASAAPARVKNDPQTTPPKMRRRR